mmetsp:Transcript_95740/g.298125  ORF Transcript_95740/g.298125 Transcript_95740/m.298125 type:complete len:269 (-) Transcript_95740:255-1061(-)
MPRRCALGKSSAARGPAHPGHAAASGLGDGGPGGAPRGHPASSADGERGRDLQARRRAALARGRGGPGLVAGHGPGAAAAPADPQCGLHGAVGIQWRGPGVVAERVADGAGGAAAHGPRAVAGRSHLGLRRRREVAASELAPGHGPRYHHQRLPHGHRLAGHHRCAPRPRDDARHLRLRRPLGPDAAVQPERDLGQGGRAPLGLRVRVAVRQDADRSSPRVQLPHVVRHDRGRHDTLPRQRRSSRLGVGQPKTGHLGTARQRRRLRPF